MALIYDEEPQAPAAPEQPAAPSSGLLEYDPVPDPSPVSAPSEPGPTPSVSSRLLDYDEPPTAPPVEDAPPLGARAGARYADQASPGPTDSGLVYDEPVGDAPLGASARASREALEPRGFERVSRGLQDSYNDALLQGAQFGDEVRAGRMSPIEGAGRALAAGAGEGLAAGVNTVLNFGQATGETGSRAIGAVTDLGGDVPNRPGFLADPAFDAAVAPASLARRAQQEGLGGVANRVQQAWNSERALEAEEGRPFTTLTGAPGTVDVTVPPQVPGVGGTTFRAPVGDLPDYAAMMLMDPTNYVGAGLGARIPGALGRAARYADDLADAPFAATRALAGNQSAGAIAALGGLGLLAADQMGQRFVDDQGNPILPSPTRWATERLPTEWQAAASIAIPVLAGAGLALGFRGVNAGAGAALPRTLINATGREIVMVGSDGRVRDAGSMYTVNDEGKVVTRAGTAPPSNVRQASPGEIIEIPRTIDAPTRTSAGNLVTNASAQLWDNLTFATASNPEIRIASIADLIETVRDNPRATPQQLADTVNAVIARSPEGRAGNAAATPEMFSDPATMRALGVWARAADGLIAMGPEGRGTLRDNLNALMSWRGMDESQLGEAWQRTVANQVQRDLGIRDPGWANPLRRYASLLDELKANPAAKDALEKAGINRNLLEFGTKESTELLSGLQNGKYGESRRIAEKLIRDMQAAANRVQPDERGMRPRLPAALDDRLVGANINPFMDLMAGSKAILSPFFLMASPRYYINNLVGDTVASLAQAGPQYRRFVNAGVREVEMGKRGLEYSKWAAGDLRMDMLGKQQPNEMLPAQRGAIRMAFDELGMYPGFRQVGKLINAPIAAANKIGEGIQALPMMNESARRQAIEAARKVARWDEAFLSSMADVYKARGLDDKAAAKAARQMHAMVLEKRSVGHWSDPADFGFVPEPLRNEVRDIARKAKDSAEFLAKVDALVDQRYANVERVVASMPERRAREIIALLEPGLGRKSPEWDALWADFERLWNEPAPPVAATVARPSASEGPSTTGPKQDQNTPSVPPRTETAPEPVPTRTEPLSPRDAYLRQLVDAARQANLPKDVAEIRLALDDAFYTTNLKPAGISEAEFYGNIRITFGDDTPDGGALTQVDTNTPEFRRWFGESKVVDANGAALRVYRGDPQAVSQFDFTRLGESSRNATAQAGFYFSEQPDVANQFMPRTRDMSAWPPRFEYAPGAQGMVYHLSVQNPRVMSLAEWRQQGANPRLRAELEAQGYDGIKIVGTGRPAGAQAWDEYEATNWVIFRPEQAKSAFNTRPSTNPDIRYMADRRPDFKDDRIVRGYNQLGEDGIIYEVLTREANVSTVLHEGFHSYQRYMEAFPEQFGEPMRVLRETYGDDWEAQARGYERWVREGNAPTPALDAVFAKIRDWMVAIYERITGTAIDVKLTNEAREAFQMLFGGPRFTDDVRLRGNFTAEGIQQARWRSVGGTLNRLQGIPETRPEGVDSVARAVADRIRRELGFDRMKVLRGLDLENTARLNDAYRAAQSRGDDAAMRTIATAVNAYGLLVDQYDVLPLPYPETTRTSGANKGQTLPNRQGERPTVVVRRGDGERLEGILKDTGINAYAKAAQEADVWRQVYNEARATAITQVRNNSPLDVVSIERAFEPEPYRPLPDDFTLPGPEGRIPNAPEGRMATPRSRGERATGATRGTPEGMAAEPAAPRLEPGQPMLTSQGRGVFVEVRTHSTIGDPLSEPIYGVRLAKTGVVEWFRGSEVRRAGRTITLDEIPTPDPKEVKLGEAITTRTRRATLRDADFWADRKLSAAEAKAKVVAEWRERERARLQAQADTEANAPTRPDAAQENAGLAEAAPARAGEPVPEGRVPVTTERPLPATREEVIQRIFEAAQEALRSGRQVAVPSQYRVPLLSSPDQIRMSGSGIQVKSGRSWVWITTPQADSIARQVGAMTTWDWMDARAGQDVPAPRIDTPEAAPPPVEAPVSPPVARLEPAASEGPQVREWRERVERYRRKKSLSGPEESLLKVYEANLAADPAKWSVGQGVSYGVVESGRIAQTNRGFRIVAIDAANKTAIVQQVADTGLTSTGGNFDRSPRVTVPLGQLKRDRKYDGPASSAAQENAGLAEAAPALQAEPRTGDPTPFMGRLEQADPVLDPRPAINAVSTALAPALLNLQARLLAVADSVNRLPSPFREDVAAIAPAVRLLVDNPAASMDDVAGAMPAIQPTMREQARGTKPMQRVFADQATFNKLKDVADQYRAYRDALDAFDQSRAEALRQTGLPPDAALRDEDMAAVLRAIPDPHRPGWVLEDGTPYDQIQNGNPVRTMTGWQTPDGRPVRFTNGMDAYVSGTPDPSVFFRTLGENVKDGARRAVADMDALPDNVIRLVDRRAVREAQTTAHAYANRTGEADARRALFGYDDRSYGQYALDHWAPYSYWTISHIAQAARYLARRPGQYFTLMSMVRDWAEANEDQSEGNKFTVFLFRAPDGTEVRIRPYMLLPFATAGIGEILNGESSRGWARELMGIAGLNPHTPIDLAAQAATTAGAGGLTEWLTGPREDNRARTLTTQGQIVNRVIRAVFGDEIGTMLDPMAPVRQGIYGTTRFGLDDYYTGMELARRADQGEITVNEGRQAFLSMRDGRPNALWQSAAQASSGEQAAWSLLRYFGIPVSGISPIRQETDADARAFFGPAGGLPREDLRTTAARNAFLDERPGLQVRWAANDDADKLRRGIANDEVSEKYKRLQLELDERANRGEITGREWQAARRELSAQEAAEWSRVNAMSEGRNLGRGTSNPPYQPEDAAALKEFRARMRNYDENDPSKSTRDAQAYLATLSPAMREAVLAAYYQNETPVERYYRTVIQPQMDAYYAIPQYSRGTPEQQQRWERAYDAFNDAYRAAIARNGSTSGASAAAFQALAQQGLSRSDYEQARANRSTGRTDALKRPEFSELARWWGNSAGTANTSSANSRPTGTTAQAPGGTSTRGSGTGSVGTGTAQGVQNYRAFFADNSDYRKLANSTDPVERAQSRLLLAQNFDALVASGWRPTGERPDVRRAEQEVERARIFATRPTESNAAVYNAWLAQGNARKLNELNAALGIETRYPEYTPQQLAIVDQYMALPTGRPRSDFLAQNPQYKPAIDAYFARQGWSPGTTSGTVTAPRPTTTSAPFVPRSGGGGGGGGGGGSRPAQPGRPAQPQDEVGLFLANVPPDVIAAIRTGTANSPAIMSALRRRFPFGVPLGAPLETWLAVARQRLAAREGMAA